MKWSKKHDRFIVKQTMNEQKALREIKRFDKILLGLTIGIGLFYIGFAILFYVWK